MSQHDYNAANASGAAFRADLNLLFAAILSNNSGATEPAVTAAFMWWHDTDNSLLKIRNAANSAWIVVMDLSAAAARAIIHAGALSTPGLSFSGDANTGLYAPAADQVGLVAGGVELLRATASLLTFLGTAAVQLPSGTTAERPTPAAGMLRYNSTTGSVEAYFGGQWTALGGTPSPSVAVKTAGYTATTAEDLIIIDSAAATSQVLYAANAVGRKQLKYQNINEGIATISCDGSDKIVHPTTGEQETTLELARGQSITLIPDGSSKWYVI